MDPSIETAARNIFDRAKAILLTPKSEWEKIAAETTPVRDIFLRYVMPLAAIGPLARLLREQLFGYGAAGFHLKPGLVWSLSSAVVSYALGLAAVVVAALIADFLAPKFEGKASRDNAFKLIAYGGTAAWVAQIFWLLPWLGFFAILGLYSLYLLYTGISPMMKVPQDKQPVYAIATIVASAILMALAAPIAGRIVGAPGGGSMDMTTDGKLMLPGGATVDAGKLDQLGKQAEAIASGNVQPVDIAKLQALLPVAVGIYRRIAVESTGLGKMGGQVEGTYSAGGNNFELRIVDMSALGSLAGIGAAMGVEQSREDADGYERTTTADGQMQTESWRNSESRGKFGTVVANRFMIEADGKAASIDELKEAVASVDRVALAALIN